MVGIILARVILFFNYFLLFFDKMCIAAAETTPGDIIVWRPRKPYLKHVYRGVFTDCPAKNKVPQ
jgi:hypothetical protein